jgi:hypothetical protein
MLRSPVSINAVPTVPLELVAAFGARKLTATFGTFVLSDRPTAASPARQLDPSAVPANIFLMVFADAVPIRPYRAFLSSGVSSFGAIFLSVISFNPYIRYLAQRQR